MTARSIKIMVATLVITVVGAAVALSQNPGHPMHGGPGGFEHHILGFLTERLDLNDAQRAQVKAILEKEKPTIQPLMKQLGDSHDQIMREATSGSFDEAKIRSIATQQSQAQIDLAVEHAKIANQVFSVLNADQKTKALQMLQHKENHMQHMQQGQEPPPPPEE